MPGATYGVVPAGEKREIEHRYVAHPWQSGSQLWVYLEWPLPEGGWADYYVELGPFVVTAAAPLQTIEVTGEDLDGQPGQLSLYVEELLPNGDPLPDGSQMHAAFWTHDYYGPDPVPVVVGNESTFNWEGVPTYHPENIPDL